MMKKLGIICLILFLALALYLGSSIVALEEQGVLDVARDIPRTDPWTVTGCRIEDIPEAVRGQLSFKFGGGWFALDANCPEDWWYHGSFCGPKRVYPLSTPGISVVRGWLLQPGFWWTNTSMENSWEAHVSPAIDWNLSISLGTAGGEIDLRGIRTDCHIRLLNSQLILRPAEAGQESSYSIMSFRSHLIMEIPQDAPVRIRFSGISAKSNLLDLGWEIVDKYYVSPAWSPNTKAVDVQANMLYSELQVIVIEQG